MAPPRAFKNFQQHQPITTTLRNICKYYPPKTCLRELLQNADDAGASEIEYVLDTKSYPADSLLHPELAEYHGPALLARNNSIFTDKDFASLSSVGDSGKQNDPASTGKFGQGFNSVYHWTDGPWIYSRNLLLILDPHHRWSNETDKPGGPAWDVVENRDNLEIQNHLKTLEVFNVNHEVDFEETIIRIPLRSQKQADISKIVKKETTVEEIKEALREFAQEIQEGGLLFLKHLRKLVIRFDNEVISTAEIIDDDSVDTSTRKELPSEFKNMFVPDVYNGPSQVLRTFEVSIRYSEDSSSWKDTYLLEHSMARSSGDKDLDSWARELKLFPWVAVAAPLENKKHFRGKLYSTLRLSIETHQPVHLHGSFSITPDRARLVSEDQAMKWNHYLFKDRISAAWARLILHRSSVSCKIEGFGLWPRADLTPIDPWAQLDMWTLATIIKEDMRVWNSRNGTCLEFSHGLFARSDKEDRQYDLALAQVKLPAVMLEASLFRKVENVSKSQGKIMNMKTPTSVRKFLRQVDLPVLSQEIAACILEYCLLDAIHSSQKGPDRAILYSDLQAIRLWPTVGGTLAICSGEVLLIPRDPEEMALFSMSRAQKTLDINQITPGVRSLLQSDIEYIQHVMRRRTLSDLAIDWPIMLPIDHCPEELVDIVARPQQSDDMFQRIWQWLKKRWKEEKAIPSVLHALWLLPINGCRIRRFKPTKSLVPTLVLEKSDHLAQILSGLLSDRSASPTILDTASMTVGVVKPLRELTSSTADFHLAFPSRLEPFLDWLILGKGLLAALRLDHRNLLLDHLAKLLRDDFVDFGQSSAGISSRMRKLPLFSKSTSTAPFKSWVVSMSTISQDGRSYELPLALPPLPDIEGLNLYNLSDASEKYIVCRLKLLETASPEHILTRHLLPWMQKTQEDSMSWVKENLVGWIFMNSISPTESWTTNIMSQPIVPLPLVDGKREYGCLKDLIDPTSIYAGLYFEDENVFPCPTFFARHKAAFVACGISNGFKENTPFERAKAYSGHSAESRILIAKVGQLLRLPIPESASSSASVIEEIRKMAWLPGILPDNSSACLAPDSCRGAHDSHLVDMVWGTVKYSIGRDWMKLFGWDRGVPTEVLFRQLDLCLETDDRDRIDKILPQIKATERLKLQLKPCILGSHGKFLTPTRVFLPDLRLQARSLFPYIDEVDSKFASVHREMLSELGVKEFPSAKDLQDILRELPKYQDSLLNDQDLDIAIYTLEMVTILDYDPIGFPIPDTTSTLRSLPDIVYGDLNVTGDVTKFHFTHPKMSEDLIKRLGVENAFARATRLEIDFEDQDEDEYIPQERLSTIISDTLGRYPIDTTFNEFLANADDAGATAISWVLDECHTGSHESQSLLDVGLSKYQGPSLMVHNDGVFSEKDFAGLKDIGQGGKSDDASTTGMFGRGALSMYHFTDVPMIVSGGYYLVLDPQQKCLPKNKHFKRKVGVKISIARVRRIASDQLAPFVGFHGFDPALDYYDGTIFRFPFRGRFEPTSLRDSLKNVDSRSTQKLLEDYFSVARVSLLFLQNVVDISFNIRGKLHTKWSVSARRSEGSEDEVFRQVTITTMKEGFESMTDIWRVGIMDVEQSPADVVKVGKSSSKVTECGVAACLQEGGLVLKREVTNEYSFKSVDILRDHPLGIVQKVFCKLPTTSLSQLPISFHASFAITGDRKTIPFEDSSEIAKWNKWLVTDRVPAFYLEFLKDLAKRLGQEVYRYWPLRPDYGDISKFSSAMLDSFWQMLTDGEHITYEMYPNVDLYNDMAPAVNDLRRATPRKIVRKLHAVTALRTAVFDFLSEKISSTLRPLFALLRLNLVRPPRRMWRYIKKAAADIGLVELNRDFLAKIFRQECNCVHLETFLGQLGNKEKMAEVMATLLETLILSTDLGDLSSLDILDGCRILPRPSLDAPLRLLKKSSAFDRDTQWQLVMDPTPQRLFEYASERLVNTKLFSNSDSTNADGKAVERRDPIAELMRASFNIRRWTISDIGTLLSHSLSPCTSPLFPERREDWTTELWTVINSHLQSQFQNPVADLKAGRLEDFLRAAKLKDRAIYRIGTAQHRQYLTPDQFENGPYIVSSNVREEQSLCSFIPNLQCLDRSCLPKILVDAEKDLRQVASFQRFLTALGRIEKSEATPIKRFLGRALTEIDNKKLLPLIVNYLGQVSVAEAAPYLSILRALPAWPRQKPSFWDEYIAAEEAVFCKHSAMFMPWVRNLESYVDPMKVELEEEILIKLGVPRLTVAQFWLVVSKDLPQSMTNDVIIQNYLPLMRYIAKHGIKPYGNVAPNGNGILCAVDRLFDHEDEIFKAAFRTEADNRFVHGKTQCLRTFWLTAGLRARPPTGDMNPQHYLDCALAIDRRWKAVNSSEQFEQDAKIVASYLGYDRPAFQGWPSNIWDSVSRAKVFRTFTRFNDQPRYRQSRLQEMAQEQDHCSLQQMGKYDDVRLLWSQMKFPRFPPASQVLSKIPGCSSPATALVYKHLEFMITIFKEVSQDDLQEYLKDIKACYDHLMDNISFTQTISYIQEVKIWFNIDSAQIDMVEKNDLLESLTSAKFLCLKSPVDPLPIKVARKFLVPYEKLLKALGCAEVVQPKPPTQKASASQNNKDPMDAAIEGMRQMRDQGQLTDVIFEAEGRKLPAHKIVLAASSDYCKAQFLGEWGRLLEREAVISFDDMSFNILWTMVDFAYTGSFGAHELDEESGNDVIANFLDDMLDLLECADRWLYGRLADQVQSLLLRKSEIYVRPDNVVDVRTRASGIRADRLVAHCDAFLEANPRIMASFPSQ